MVIRAIATADNHLNRTYARLAPQKLSERRQFLRAGFRAAVEAALAWPAHLFLIGGDLFDTSDPRNQDRSFVANCVARLRAADITVCAVGGNHDTPRQSTEQGGVAPLDTYRQLGALTYFDKSATIEDIRLNIAGTPIAIGGLTPDANWTPGFDPLSKLTWRTHQDGVATSILLAHGQIEGHVLPDDDGAVFTKATLRTATDADLIVLGDIHHAPKPIDLGDGRLVVIPGATERVDFGDAADVPGYVRLEYTAGMGWQAERVPLEGQPRQIVEIHASELPATNAGQWLMDRVLAVADARTLVKLVLTGLIAREAYQALHLRAVVDALNGRVFHCTLDAYGLLVEDDTLPQVQRGVRLSQSEEIARYAAEMLDNNPDPEQQAIIQEARRRLLELY
jgi:exonuclease SbcD